MDCSRYSTTITYIGHLAAEFIEDGVIFVFNNNALDDLADVSYLHTAAKMENEVKLGDTIIFGQKEYTVTAVGSDANRTLKSMGHCAFSFNGAAKTKLPGQIELLGDGIPMLSVGDTFEILFSE